MSTSFYGNVEQQVSSPDEDRQVIEALGRAHLTTPQLARATGLTQWVVRRSLRSLDSEGVVVRDASMPWVIAYRNAKYVRGAKRKAPHPVLTPSIVNTNVVETEPSATIPSIPDTNVPGRNRWARCASRRRKFAGDPVVGETFRQASGLKFEDPAQRKMFCLIAAYRDGGLPRPPIKALATRVGVDVHEARGLLRVLEREGQIRRTKKAYFLTGLGS
jgi:predicted transcriptional regulator